MWRAERSPGTHRTALVSSVFTSFTQLTPLRYITLAANVSYGCDRSYNITFVHNFRLDYVTIIHINGSGKLKSGGRFSSEKHIILMLQEIMHGNNTSLGRGG